MSVPSTSRKDGPEGRRATDTRLIFGWFWDWIDKRQIDAWVITGFSFWISAEITFWAMGFANQHPDANLTLTVGVISLPWAALQGAVIKFHLDARTESFEPKRSKG